MAAPQIHITEWWQLIAFMVGIDIGRALMHKLIRLIAGGNKP